MSNSIINVLTVDRMFIQLGTWPHILMTGYASIAEKITNLIIQAKDVRTCNSQDLEFECFVK